MEKEQTDNRLVLLLILLAFFLEGFGGIIFGRAHPRPNWTGVFATEAYKCPNGTVATGRYKALITPGRTFDHQSTGYIAAWRCQDQ